MEGTGFVNGREDYICRAKAHFHPEEGLWGLGYLDLGKVR